MEAMGGLRSSAGLVVVAVAVAVAAVTNGNMLAWIVASTECLAFAPADE
jgi:hypothetical protein